MENFQYSVQLSDQDWAEFSATTEECGLLQASLASGDELLSSDIDQGDSSGSSPPGPRPLLGGSGWPGFEEEDQAATKQLVSRGKGPSAGSAEWTSGAGQDERGLESAGAPEQVARPGLDLSAPVLTTEQGSDPLSMTPRAGPHAVATPAPEPGPDFSMAPRILKHLPPPAASAVGGPGYKSCFAVTVPEAYEFFFCDTIEEEEEEEEEEAEAGEAQVQWPEVCEFFFRDSRATRSGPRGGPSPAPAPEAKPVPSALPGDPRPISFPEAYEHFLGADSLEGVLGPAAPLPLQAREAPTPGPQGVQPGPAPEPSPVATEQLDLVLRQAGEPWGPLTSFTFSQKDMCLVFVAFATWAVRTSDLHTPDAWKTVLLANIGTISAIRYFRRQVRLGRRSPSP
ncbi:hypothetical protein MDA_GLEAN10007530 [Myotis davidii]|uniref:PGC-1 and ERR-induced regulator in muscle protein 1 n=1 Tax=Myotis davidii TaxID=225400 RepID=L5LD94_MYODS|nr:hypothetical protein MDA_GLEAN10007530 [Myotis davidii]